MITRTTFLSSAASTAALRRATTPAAARSASGLRFASTNDGGGGSGSGAGGNRESAPRSQSKPAQAGEVKKDTSMMTIGGVGLALGAVFLYILARPEKAATQSGFGGPNPTGGGRPGNSNEGSGAGSRTPGQRAS